MNEFKPMVSIVIPVYNGSRYMREAIDSALAQTYENIEVIVVNDGSTDDTEEIALSYGEKVRYFAKENGGVSTALNIGIKNMKGEYFSWLSHDDVYYPHKIEKSIEAIKDCPDCIVYSNYDVIDSENNIVETADFRKYYRYANQECGTSVVLNGAANGCTIMIPYKKFDIYGQFDENLRTTQDYDLFFKMFREQKLVFVNESLIKFRVHNEQQTNVNPRTVSEGNDLWINIFESLTNDEIILLGGSHRMFWREKADMLKTTSFIGAVEYAENKYEECVSKLKCSKISVVMPFYNRLDLMPKTIESVINQSYENWELILANDGTSEDIGEIEKIVESDERIKLINLPHKGVSVARNRAMEASSGEFIAILDSDDLWMPNKLEKHLEFMLEHCYAFAYTSFEQRYLNGNLYASNDVSHFFGDVFYKSISEWAICTSSVMFERSILGDLKFPENIHLGEDICLWLHFLWRFNGGAVPDVLTTMRIQKVSASQNIVKRRKAVCSVIGYVLEHFYFEECMPYLHLLSHHLTLLFPSPDNSEEETESYIEPSDQIIEKKIKTSLPKRIIKSIARKIINPIIMRIHHRFVMYINDELRLPTRLGELEANTITIQRTLDSEVNQLTAKFYQIESNQYEARYVLDRTRDEVGILESKIKLHHEIVEVNSAAFSEYKNIYSGRDVVVMGAGPTLNNYMPIKDAIHIGVNRVFLYDKVNLDYLFVADAKGITTIDSFERGKANKDCKLFFGLYADTPNGTFEPNESISASANATRFYFADPSVGFYPDIRYRPLMIYYTVAIAALHFALFTNPRRIYIAGVDMSLDGHFGGNRDQDIEVVASELKSNLIGFRHLKEFAQKWYPETEIVSINPVNLKGLFNDLYTDNSGNGIENMDYTKESIRCDFSNQEIENYVNKYVKEKME